MIRSISSAIDEYSFGDGTDARLNMGKTSDVVNIKYFCSQTDEWLARLDELCEDGVEVTVSGLQDLYLNTSYLIVDYEVKQDTNNPCTYEISISLERTMDRLP